MEKKIPIKTIYLLLVISLGLVGLGIGSTYAVFTASSEIISPISLSSNLSYGSNVLETVSVKVLPGEVVSTTLNITNSSTSNLNYVTWYIDEGYDIDVVGETGQMQGTLSPSSTSSIIVGVRNYSDETITVNIGISSNEDSIVLGNNMKIVESVNFLMNVEERPSDTTALFLRSNLQRGQIESVTFVDNINIPSGNTSVDVSKHNDGTVMMWYGSANTNSRYDVYIGSSKGITYLDSGYSLFGRLENCTSINFNNLLNTSKTINMSQMFDRCMNIIELDVENWDISNVITLGTMFQGCSKLITLDVSNWNTSKVTDMTFMFNACYDLAALDVSSWDTSKVTGMASMFSGCISLTELDLSNWDVGNVTTMERMFLTAPKNGEMSLTTIGDISNWDTSKVTNMSYMFQLCTKLTKLDLSNWDVSNVTTMKGMFISDSKSNGMSLTTIGDVSNWNTSKVTDMNGMFQNCVNLTELDLSGWDTSKVTDMYGMFQKCTSLKTIYVSDKWNMGSVTDSSYMFYGCTSLVGGNGTTYNASYIDKTYARIDTAGTPGYFTKKSV